MLRTDIAKTTENKGFYAIFKIKNCLKRYRNVR